MNTKENFYCLVLSTGQARFLATSKYGIDRMSEKKIEEYDNKATQILDKLSARGLEVSPLRELSQKLLNRDK